MTDYVNIDRETTIVPIHDLKLDTLRDGSVVGQDWSVVDAYQITITHLLDAADLATLVSHFADGIGGERDLTYRGETYAMILTHDPTYEDISSDWVRATITLIGEKA